jgi:hypothetical protein
LNPIQTWALGYSLVMSRRTLVEDKKAELEMQTFNLFPERWMEVYEQRQGYSSNAPGDLGVAFGGEQELPVTAEDIDSLSTWVDRSGETKRMNGGQAPQDDWMKVLGYAEGPGIRV